MVAPSLKLMMMIACYDLFRFTIRLEPLGVSNMSTHEPASPLENFSGCHEGILKQIQQLALLASLVTATEPMPQVKALAGQVEDFYHKVILKHHQEEEQELFTAVRTALHPDPLELADAKSHIERLTQEHRQIEAWWREIEPALKKLAKGKAVNLDKAIVEQLVAQYTAHALFEEAVFLPLSARLLDKNGMSALGLSLHIRHQDGFIPAYI
jgi:hemerythrin-like domain-containing protein